MPATAGRVRMPANNRVHSSAALQTHIIWQSAIGHDPHAPNKEETKDASVSKSSNPQPDAENAYLSFQGLLELARLNGQNNDEPRGACKKCGRVGHLPFQCRNFLSTKDETKQKSLDGIDGGGKLMDSEILEGLVDSDESEDEDESSDSDIDSEMERIIAERYGKKTISKKSKSGRKKKVHDDSDTDSACEREKRGRSKKRSSRRREEDVSDDEDGSSKKRRRENRRKKDESSNEDDDDDDDESYKRKRHRKSRKEKRRRRSHRYSDDDSGSDDSRVGRDKKRSERSRKRQAEED